MPAADALGPQWGPRHPLYAAWHAEHVDGPVRAEQRAHEVQAAKRELGNARFHSQQGDRAAAARALRRAANARRVASRMPL